jgi:hypothetical protein
VLNLIEESAEFYGHMANLRSIISPFNLIRIYSRSGTFFWPRKKMSYFIRINLNSAYRYGPLCPDNSTTFDVNPHFL